MRPASLLAAAALTALIASGSAMAADEDASAEEARNGPFVMTERTLGSLLDTDFEIKGILGGSLILVKEAELFSCALVPGAEMLTYKTQFECARLDEIPSGE